MLIIITKLFNIVKWHKKDALAGREPARAEEK